MTDIQNLQGFDPFADVEGGIDEVGNSKNENYVHIRIQQRNGRKTLTTVQGLNKDLDFRKILKAFKRTFCCNGTIVDDPDLGQVIQLQGDQRQKIAEWLVEQGICAKGTVKIHGF